MSQKKGNETQAGLALLQVRVVEPDLFETKKGRTESSCDTERQETDQFGDGKNPSRWHPSDLAGDIDKATDNIGG